MSTENKFVIKGEASESDDEDINIKKQDEIQHGLAVDGEAPESDEDIISYCKEAVAHRYNKQPTKRDSDLFHRKQDSFLQRKLIETNAALWRDINQFIQSTVLNASKQILNADQRLLKSQVALQTASHNLKSANDASKHVLDKTKDVVTASFIPHIRNMSM